MKKYMMIVATVFSIFISSNLIYAGALNKEQTIIDAKNKQINIIDRKNIKESIQMKDNSIFKTITLNRNPIFETNTITVRDTVHYSNNNLEAPGKTFSIADTKAIELLTKALNEEPFYESDVAFSSAYSAYYLDFNNGVVLEVCDSKLSTCIIKIGHETKIYQIPFKASIAIEQFVKNNIDADSMNQNKEKWYYDICNSEEMYYKEYISCDYFDDDYSQLIQYLETKIEDFSLKYSYKIQKDDSGIKIYFTSKENSFSVRIYESIGAIRSYVDAEIAGLE